MNRRSLMLWTALAFLAGGCKVGENIRGTWYDCPCECVDCSIRDEFGACDGGVTPETSRVCSMDYTSAELLCIAACDANETIGVIPCYGSCPPGGVTIGPLAECSLDVGPQAREANSCTPGQTGTAAARGVARAVVPSSASGVVMSAPSYTAMYAVVQPSTSVVRLSVNDVGSGTFAPVGRMVVSGGWCAGVGGSCALRVEAFELAAQSSFGVGDRTVRDFALMSAGEFISTVGSDGRITADVRRMPNADSRGHVGSDYYSRSGRPVSFQGTFDPIRGRIHVEGAVSMSQGSSSYSIDAVFVDSPPMPVLDGLATVECGISTRFSSERSYDPDGDAIVRREWFEQVGTDRTPLGESVAIERAFPVGHHVVGVRLTDERGRWIEGFYGFDVADTLPPVIEPLEGRACLWPPDHELVPIVLESAQIPTIYDVCDGEPAVRFLSATSNQPEGANGPDAVVSPGEEGVCLRAERLGTDPAGRVYELSLVATDRAGNTTSGTTQVSVAHDQRPDSRCPQIPESAFATLDDPRCAVAVVGDAAPEATSGGVQDDEARLVSTGGCRSGGGAEALALAGLLLALRSKRARAR